MTPSTGAEMHQWLTELFPICRSITGKGVRETLTYLKKLIPELKIHSIPTGTKAFDWTIPNEWNITDAYIEDEKGIRIVDFQQNNLHVVGYSTPIDQWVSLDELNEHLYSKSEYQNAIPYVTSYYRETWGFCMAHQDRMQLKPGQYHVVIQSRLEPGEFNYGDVILPGKCKQEILLSTYICHPSLANNELSGPVVTTALARWLSSLSNRDFTYRIVFVPETIGSIVYLSQHWEQMKKNTIAGFVVTCVGDDRSYSFLASRYGNTLTDRLSRHVLKYNVREFQEFSYLDRGSDERQYSSPGIDLPIASIMRSKYGTFPEYHTSDDNLSLVTPSGLEGAYQIYKKCLYILEHNKFYTATHLCEPKLDQYGLKPTISNSLLADHTKLIINFLSYADGNNDVIDIANIIKADAETCINIAIELLQKGLVKESNPQRNV